MAAVLVDGKLTRVPWADLQRERESDCYDWCESVLSLLELLRIWHRMRVCNRAMWMEGGAAVSPPTLPGVFMAGRAAARPSAWLLFRMRR
eukprot:2371977-Amphidinium_carterae.1